MISMRGLLVLCLLAAGCGKSPCKDCSAPTTAERTCGPGFELLNPADPNDGRCVKAACDPTTTDCPVCQNLCAMVGTTLCMSGGVLTCVAQSDGCLTWSAAVACPSGS